MEGSWFQFEEGTTALIPEENVLMDTENAWISVRQLSAGFGTMLTSGVESIPDQAGWALNARSLHSKAGARFRARHLLNLAKRLFSNRQLSVFFGMLPRVWSPTESHPPRAPDHPLPAGLRHDAGRRWVRPTAPPKPFAHTKKAVAPVTDPG